MASTHKDNILTIAPELTDFLQNTRQKVTLTVSTAEDVRDYIVTVEKVDYTTNSGVGATVISIATAIKSTIDTASLGLEIIDNGDGTLTIYADNSGIRFDINSDLDRYISIVFNTNAALGDNLLGLILDEVHRACPYARYGDEEEVAQRYLAAHILTILKNNSSSSSVTSAAGGLIRRKVGNVETWFSDGGASIDLDAVEFDLMSTIYGKRFLEIKRRHSVYFV